MLFRLMKFEFKNLIRDRMTAMLLVYPLMVGFLGKYLLDTQDFDENGINLLIVALTIISGMIFGSMAGFSILDDRDDNVFLSIQISPMNVRFYVWVKVIFIYTLSVLANILIFVIMGGLGLELFDFILISLLIGLQVPINAFLINALSSNKVEGFIAMKGSGFLIIFPIVAFFFLDWKEWLFAFAPAFWGAKAVQVSLLQPYIDLGVVSMNLNFWMYLGIGFIYNLVLVYLMYNVFKRKYM
jgi:fluoroquinolone transport system permease protein